MSTIVTRTGKGTPLTYAEVDANFTNLNTDKYQSGDNPSFGNITATKITFGGVDFSGSYAQLTSKPTIPSLTSQLTNDSGYYKSGDTASFAALSVGGNNVSGFAGMRNRLINGDMRVDQRNNGASRTFTAGAALSYCVDRWYGYCTGANVTGQQIAGTAPNPDVYRFTGAASVTKIGFGQRIESVNCQDLAGTTATLSVDLANSVLTTVTWTAWYANTTDTFGTLASPTRTQIATGTFTVNSTVTRYSTQISIPSAATTGIEVEFSVGAQTSGTWTIGRAQLEPGSVATPFEVRPYALEEMNCRRYYYRIFPGVANSVLGVGVAVNATSGSFIVNYPVPMRVSPSSVEQTGTAADYCFTNIATNVTCSGVPVMAAPSNQYMALMSFPVASGLTGGNAGLGKALTANGYLGWSAEL